MLNNICGESFLAGTIEELIIRLGDFPTIHREVFQSFLGHFHGVETFV